jgi:hypothetical protein
VLGTELWSSLRTGSLNYKPSLQLCLVSLWKIPTDTFTGQPCLDSLSLRFPFQVTLCCVKLTVRLTSTHGFFAWPLFHVMFVLQEDGTHLYFYQGFRGVLKMHTNTSLFLLAAMAMTGSTPCSSMSNHTKERVTMTKVTLENFYSNLIAQHEEREMR